MATGYVANWGNDDNDGLTWETAKRSLLGTATLDPVYVKGYYNENFSNRRETYGTGNFVLDNTYTDNFLNKNNNTSGVRFLRNVKIIGNQDVYTKGGWAFENVFINLPGNNVNLNNFANTTNSNLVVVCNIVITNITNINNCSVKCNTFIWNNTTNLTAPLIHSNNIVSANDLELQTDKVQYSLFIDCAVKITGGGLGNDETAYAVPVGATDTDKIENLRSRMATVFGGLPSDYLVGCRYYSGSYTDIFVDADNGDFNLIPNCIAAHMSFYGDYIGARAEGVKANWNADYTNIINIDVNGNITDQNIDAGADTIINDIGHIRKIKSITALGQRAMRNGQQINTEVNLGPDIAAGTNVLVAGKVYQCLNDLVVIDNAGTKSLSPYECYYAIDEGGGAGLGFTGTGIMKEVLIDKYDEKIQLKFHKTDATLVSANLVTCYLYRETNFVMVNEDGSGNPLYGDADVGYNPAIAVMLETRYWQAFPLIKALNLAPR